MIKQKIASIVFAFLFFSATAQTPIQRIDPPNWWVGMKNTQVQLLVYGTNISVYQAAINYEGISRVTQSKVENPNYLFVDLNIAPDTKPGIIKLNFTNPDTKKSISYDYELKARKAFTPKGLSSSDLIYLIMPDRFSNGDETNNVVKNYTQTTLNRDSMFLRHGGDLQGIINHLNYVKEIGTTAIWLNPIQENNQPKESYHGYAITDHYNIDKRFGTNEKYIEFVNKTHEQGMKVVMDVVPNHCGNQHYLIKDLPCKDWIHQWDSFSRTNYRAPTIIDPHASQYDKKIMSDGWFDKHMPDLNQQNKFLAKYLIQNAIWWVEYAQLDAYRIDTYAYPDANFMNDWASTLFNEYPTLGMFGEIWDHGVSIQAHFTKDSETDSTFKSKLPGVTDFQLNFALTDALNKEFGWTDGTARIYYTLAQDNLYSDATKNVVFLDNHDVSRFYSMVNEDIEKFKMGIAFLMTTRGIPMLYYGTEILMKNYANPDGKVREDFPGGWKTDKQNKFIKEGRGEKENDAFDYVKKLANYRKTSAVLGKGELIQFVPDKSCYVYFRQLVNDKVMCIMNSTNEKVNLKLNRFNELLSGAKTFKNIITDKEFPIEKTLEIPAKTLLILEVY